MDIPIEHNYYHKMHMVIDKDKKVGQIFICQSSTKSFVKINDEYLKNVPVYNVKDVLEKFIIPTIKEQDQSLAPVSCYLPPHVHKTDDIVIKFIDLIPARLGTIYITLQISSKNEGTLRLTSFVTNTVNHDSIALSSVPFKYQDVEEYIEKTLNKNNSLLKVINELKTLHSTQKSAEQLLREIVIS
jgi:hypothetical protein